MAAWAQGGGEVEGYPLRDPEQRGDPAKHQGDVTTRSTTLPYAPQSGITHTHRYAPNHWQLVRKQRNSPHYRNATRRNCDRNKKIEPAQRVELHGDSWARLVELRATVAQSLVSLATYPSGDTNHEGPRNVTLPMVERDMPRIGQKPGKIPKPRHKAA